MEYLSKEGMENLKNQLEEHKEKRQEISHRIEESKKFGDLSENAEYMEAREAQEFNERKIVEIEEILRNAVLIEKSRIKGIVQVGSTIEVKLGGKTYQYTIVGSEESDPVAGKISNESPLGKAFLGKKLKEEVGVKTPQGEVKYRIITIK